MKNIILTIFLTLSMINIGISQNITELDKKMGYMDIKIGDPISYLSAKVEKDKEENKMYLIKDLSEYQIENQKIDKIIILVSDDQKIEHFTLLFIDKVPELIRIAQDNTVNFEKRQKALAKAEELDKIGLAYKFYRNLFGDAFGEPTSIEKGIEKWTGEKMRLMCSNSNVTGICNFSTVLSDEELIQRKNEKAQKASSKF